MGFRAREPSCPSETVSQALEVHGHVRSHSGPMEEDLVGPGHRAAVQDKSKKVKASQDNKSWHLLSAYYMEKALLLPYPFYR